MNCSRMQFGVWFWSLIS